MLEPLSFAERKRVLARLAEALQHYERAISSASLELPWSDAEAKALAQAEAAFSAAKGAEGDYFERLPRIAMGCCPFDGKPLMRSIDPFGIDGPWWHPDAVSQEPVPCPHFCVLLGAARPEAPYVVPRLLRHPSMNAVLAELQLLDLPRLVTIAYFAERRPMPELLTADWPRRNFVYTTQRGTQGWRPAREVRDFELLPWLQAGKLRWCEPGSDNTKLAPASPERFPFLERG
jgi:hypothetical protein